METAAHHLAWVMLSLYRGY